MRLYIVILLLCMNVASLWSQQLSAPRLTQSYEYSGFYRNNAIIGVSWIVVSTATQYLVDVALDSTFQRVKLRNYTDPTGINIRFQNDSLIEFRIAELYDYTKYYIRVRAVRGKDTSAFSRTLVAQVGETIPRFLLNVRRLSASSLVVEIDTLLPSGTFIEVIPRPQVQNPEYPLLSPPSAFPPADSNLSRFAIKKRLLSKRDTITNIRPGLWYYFSVTGGDDTFFPIGNYFSEFLWYLTPSDSIETVLDNVENISYYQMPSQFGITTDSLYYSLRINNSKISDFAQLDSLLFAMITKERIPIDSVWILSGTLSPVRIPESPPSGMSPSVIIKLKNKDSRFMTSGYQNIWREASGGRFFVQHFMLPLIERQMYRRYTVKRVPTSVQESSVTREPLVQMLRCFPQPLRDEGRISYVVPESGSIRIEIVDILGIIRQTILNGVQYQGEFQTAFTSHSLANGRYYVRYQFSGSHQAFRQTIPLNILR